LTNFAAFVREKINDSWIDDLIDKNITDINDVIESLEYIESHTESDNSLNTSDELKKIVAFIIKLQNFVDSDEKELNFTTALNITNDFMRVYNNLINQNNAWINTKVDEKTRIASNLLLYVQKSSYVSRPFINGTNKIIELNNRNIFMKIYSTNCSESIVFESNGNSIEIPREIYFDGSDECYDYGVGYAINKLGDYLSEDNSEIDINTNIIAFSIINTNKTNLINDGLKVKIM
jgi:methionyl-tRNA synthetase